MTAEAFQQERRLSRTDRVNAVAAQRRTPVSEEPGLQFGSLCLPDRCDEGQTDANEQRHYTPRRGPRGMSAEPARTWNDGTTRRRGTNRASIIAADEYS